MVIGFLIFIKTNNKYCYLLIMSCQKKIQIPRNQAYRLTYPEKNVVWMSSVPDNRQREQKKECCQRMLYTPTIKNKCNSTFMPWDRPDPYQCLKLCKGIDVLKINGCQAQKMQNNRRINNNGCLMEPSIAEYTNVSTLSTKSNILTDPNRFAPNVPQYGYKNSDAYDPIQYVFGKSYTY